MYDVPGRIDEHRVGASEDVVGNLSEKTIIAIISNCTLKLMTLRIQMLGIWITKTEKCHLGRSE